MNIKEAIKDFLEKKITELDIYNEFALQFELGKYLEKELSGYRVQFERNVVDFFIDGNKDTGINDKRNIKNNFYKREIDLVIFNNDKPCDATEKYAVELKYIMPKDPTTDKMGHMLEDIAFIQQLTNAENFEPNNKDPFDMAFAVTLCNIQRFWKGKQESDIYKIFRSGVLWNNDREWPLRGEKKIRTQSFSVKWKKTKIKGIDYHYYIVDASQAQNKVQEKDNQKSA